MHLVSTRMEAAATLLLEWAAEVALTTWVHIPIFQRRRLNSEMIFGERASVLDTPTMDCSRRTFSRKPYVYYTPMVLQDILYYILHGW